MGLILDTNIFIRHERLGNSVDEIAESLREQFGEVLIGLSVVSIAELTHGIYRAKSQLVSARRRNFVDRVCQRFEVHPVTLSIAQLVGQIEGEQAAKGIAIEFQDLVIGATAISLGFSVLTLNLNHFRLIPNLQIETL